MKFSSRIRWFLVLLLLAQTVVFTRTQDTSCVGEMVLKCKTGICDAENNCHCASPVPGSNNFLGGQYCDQPAHNCNGSTTAPLWCLDNNNSNTCAMREADGSSICDCHSGYAGAHCEIMGIVCGNGYCYNNATCLNEATSTCDCLPNWKGNANCTLTTAAGGHSGGSSIKWWGGLLIAGAVAAAVSVGAVFGLKKYRERTEGAKRFNELRKSQTRARAESDEEYDSDPYEDEVHAKSSTTAHP